MGLKLIAGVILGIWLILVLMGKGGFAHMLLLFGLSTLAIDGVSAYRARNVHQLRDENGGKPI